VVNGVVAKDRGEEADVSFCWFGECKKELGGRQQFVQPVKGCEGQARSEATSGRFVSYVGKRYNDFAVASLQPSLLAPPHLGSTCGPLPRARFCSM